MKTNVTYKVQEGEGVSVQGLWLEHGGSHSVTLSIWHPEDGEVCLWLSGAQWDELRKDVHSQRKGE